MYTVYGQDGIKKGTTSDRDRGAYKRPSSGGGSAGGKRPCGPWGGGSAGGVNGGVKSGVNPGCGKI